MINLSSSKALPIFPYIQTLRTLNANTIIYIYTMSLTISLLSIVKLSLRDMLIEV